MERFILYCKCHHAMVCAIFYVNCKESYVANTLPKILNALNNIKLKRIYVLFKQTVKS